MKTRRPKMYMDETSGLKLGPDGREKFSLQEN